MLWVPLQSAAFGAIGVAYAKVGNPYPEPIRIVDITNLTNANVLISFDGVTDHIIMPAVSGKVSDICAARTGGDLNATAIAQETQVWAKYETAAPTSGNLYVGGNYIFGD